MRIRYVGKATIREWTHGEVTHRWMPENAHTLEIEDAELVVELLTHPPSDFVIAEDEPLLAISGIGAQRVAELALVGIATVHDLAVLDDDGIARVEKAIAASEAQVRVWVDRARDIEAGLYAVKLAAPGADDDAGGAQVLVSYTVQTDDVTEED